MPKQDELSLDVIYFIAVFLISLGSLFNSGFGSFFSTLGSGVVMYVIVKIAYKYWNDISK